MCGGGVGGTVWQLGSRDCPSTRCRIPFLSLSGLVRRGQVWDATCSRQGLDAVHLEVTSEVCVLLLAAAASTTTTPPSPPPSPPLPFHSSYLFLIVYTCVSACGYVHTSADAPGGHRLQNPWTWNSRRL